jgi:hypothetical protein
MSIFDLNYDLLSTNDIFLPFLEEMIRMNQDFSVRSLAKNLYSALTNIDI